MQKTKQNGVGEGNLLRSIITYVIPITLAVLVQSLFHSADIAVLGNMADSVAVASVGAAGPFTTLILNAFLGMSSGNKALISRLYGANDEEKTRKTVDTSIVIALVGGVSVALIGILLAPQFLLWLKCPQECFDGAVIYTRIYLLAAPFILFYNAGHAVIAGCGDTKRPLYYILASGLLNLVLNIILCLILKNKVVAVALATALSQVLAGILMLHRLCRVDNICRITLSKLRFYGSEVSSIAKYSLPAAVTALLMPVSNLQIQSAINAFGVSAVAGNSASVTLEGVVSSFSTGFASAASVFVSQNLGAMRLKRARQVFKTCTLLAVSISLVFGALIYLGADLFLPLILTDDVAAIEYAKIRMIYVVLLYFVTMIASVIAHTLQAYGYAIMTTINSIVNVMIFRVIWMELIYPLSPTFGVLMQSFPISQLLMTVCGGILLYFVTRRYERRALAHARKE